MAFMRTGDTYTPGMTVRTGKLPLRPLLWMCEIGLRGELEVRSITQIQIREQIAADLGRINSRSAPLWEAHAPRWGAYTLILNFRHSPAVSVLGCFSAHLDEVCTLRHLT